MDRVLAQVQLADEVKRVGEERKRAEQQLRRLGRAYVDGLYDDEEYRRQKKRLEDKLRSLVVPDADVAVQAGRLLDDLPRLWEKADLGERRRILLTMLDAVYVDTVEEKRIVAIRPRPAFRPLLKIAATREGSGIALVNEKDPKNTNQPPPGGQGAGGGPCLWWRRGGVEPPVQKTPRSGYATGLAGSHSRPLSPLPARGSKGPADGSLAFPIGVGGTAPRFVSPGRLPRGGETMDVAACFRRLGLAVACQLLFCHLFTRGWRLGLQSRRDIPCRTHASPLYLHYSTHLASSSCAAGLALAPRPAFLVL